MLADKFIYQDLIRRGNRSPTLRIPTVQTRRAAIQDDQRLGVALVADRTRRREAGAVADECEE